MKCDICDAEMFRVPRSPENEEDVVNPYWMCSKCDHVQLVSYSVVFYRDGERTNFVLIDKDGWNKAGPLLAEHFNLFPIDEEKAEDDELRARAYLGLMTEESWNAWGENHHLKRARELMDQALYRAKRRDLARRVTLLRQSLDEVIRHLEESE